MNSDKQKLLDMIKEGERIQRSLAPGEVSDQIEQVPGTNIWVPNVRAFNASATSFYIDYLQAQNTFLSPSVSDAQVAQDVYDLLKKEMLEEENEYYISKAAEIYTNNKAMITRIGELNDIIPNIETNYKRLLEQKRVLEETSKNGYKSPDLTEQFAKTKKTLDDEIEMFRTSKSNVASELRNLQKAINKNFVDAITEEMRRIEGNYYTNSSNSNRTFSKTNGKPLLVEDEAEYEALITLLNIQSKVDFNKETFIINDCVCINEDQIELIKQYLNQVELFKKMNVVKEKTLTPEETNKILLEKIAKRLREIEKISSVARKDFTYFKPEELFDISSKDTKEQPLNLAKNANLDQVNLFASDTNTVDQVDTKKSTSRGLKISNDLLPEYENLFNIMRMLNKSTYHKTWKLVPVWDNLAYVDVLDEQAIKRAFASSKLFADLNPKKKQIAKNAELIDELKAEINKKVKDRIDAEAQATKENKMPIPILKIGTIDGNDIVVLEADFPECSNLFELINLLQDTKDEDLELTMGIAYIKHSNIPKFTNIYNMTKYFNKEKILAKEIANKKIEMENLIKKANDVPATDLSPNGLVLESDAPKLSQIKQELVDLKKQADLYAPVEDIWKDVDQEAFRIAAQNRINKEKIEEVKLKIKKFDDEHEGMTNVSKEEENYYLLLTEQLQILENSKNASTLAPIEGAKIAAEANGLNYVEKYKEIITKIKEYENLQKDNDETLLNTKAKMQEIKDILDKFDDSLSGADTKLFNLYEEQYSILESSLFSTNIEDGLRIASEYVPRYKEIEEEIKKLQNSPKYNLKEIENLDKELEKLRKENNISNITKISLLAQLLQILRLPNQNKLSHSEVKEIDGVFIPLDKEEDYKKLWTELKGLKNKISDSPLPPKYNSILPQNISTIAKINKELNDIVIESNKAFFKDKLEPASDGQMILSSMLPKYELLLQQRDILKKAKTNDGSNNIQIDEEDQERYAEIIKKLANPPQDLFDNDAELDEEPPKKKEKEPKKIKRHRVKKKRKAKEKSDSFWNRTIKAGLSSIIDSVMSAIGEPPEYKLSTIAYDYDKDILIEGSPQKDQALKNFNTEIIADQILAEASINDKRIASEFKESEDPDLKVEADLARKRIAERYNRLIKNNNFIKDETPKKIVNNDYDKLEKRGLEIQKMFDNSEDPKEKARLQEQIKSIMREKQKIAKTNQELTTSKDILDKYSLYKDLKSRIYDDKILAEFNTEETNRALEELKNIPDLAQTINSRIGTINNELYNYYKGNDKDKKEVQDTIAQLEVEYNELEEVAKLVGANLTKSETQSPVPPVDLPPVDLAPNIDSIYKIYDDIEDIAFLASDYSEDDILNSGRVISPSEIDKVDQAKDAIARMDAAAIIQNRITELDNKFMALYRNPNRTDEEDQEMDNIRTERQKLNNVIKTFNIDMNKEKAPEPTSDNIDTLDVDPSVDVAEPVKVAPQDNFPKSNPQSLKEAYEYYQKIQELQLKQQNLTPLSEEAINCGVDIANYITKLSSIDNIDTLITNRLAEVSPTSSEYTILNNIAAIVKEYNPNLNLTDSNPVANVSNADSVPSTNNELQDLYNLYDNVLNCQARLENDGAYLAPEMQTAIEAEINGYIEQMKNIPHVNSLIINNLLNMVGTPEFAKLNAIQELMYGPNEDKLTR